MEHSARRSKWLFPLLAAAFSLAVCLALVLVFLAIRGDQPIYLQEPGHERTGHRYLYDPLLGWRNIPNWKSKTLGRSLSINSKGLRDREYAFKKPRGTRRILVLGDSYAWGYGVADDETFAKVLERELRGWEVLNAGVSGWGTDQAYLYLTDEGFRYEPDLVVLALFLINDPDNNVSSRQYGLDKPVYLDSQLSLGNVPVPKPGEGSPALTSAADPIELTVAILSRMAVACRSKRCRLVIMKFGSFLVPGRPRMAKYEAKFRTQLSRAGLRYLDLDRAFPGRGYSRFQILHGNEDGHWNAFGHRQTALILAEYLRKQGFMPRASTPRAR